jgi:phosphoglycolate phosphatase
LRWSRSRIAELPGVKYPLVIFDFDGTLADSLPFFLQAQQDLAQRHGFEAASGERMEALRHLDARALLRELGIPAWKLPAMIADFLAAMRHAPPVPLFPGIADTLTQLHDRGVRLAILTSNSADNVPRVLGAELMGVIEFLDGGAHVLGKHRRISRMLKQARVASTEAIYVGDQLSDGEAARRAGVAFGAVGWGYSHPDALRASGPGEFFASVEELGRMLR